MFGHPLLYPPEVWRVDLLPLREGTFPLDTLQLAAGWFIKSLASLRSVYSIVYSLRHVYILTVIRS